MAASVDKEMFDLAVELFPICRSITGDGVRQTLQIIGKHIPLKIFEVPSGTSVFDWIVPKEWNIKNAFIADDKGNKIVDFKENNLHVVGYSTPVDKYISLSELQQHLHSLEDQPDAIPYITSYYKENWGFCLTHNKRQALRDCTYHVFIDSELKHGSLTYGECIIPGETEKEVFLSTYVCHPSMANNELSGPVVTTFLAKYILSLSNRQHTHRIIFIPETIGSITYLSKNIATMKKNIVAGFNITCVGDERAYSFLPSRNGCTLADKVALNVLNFNKIDFIRYSFLDRGSDERQYCSPGVDLPVASILRSKFGIYPEYHTSMDDLNFISANGLFQTYELLKCCLDVLNNNYRYRTTCLCEPQLGKRNLYPTFSTKSSAYSVRQLMNFLAYADGKNDLIDISNITSIPVWDFYPIIEKLKAVDLIDKIPS